MYGITGEEELGELLRLPAGDELGAATKIAEALRFDPNDAVALALHEKLKHVFGDVSPYPTVVIVTVRK